jgi:hypothetical protein
VPFDKEPQPNCGNYEHGEKEKREHIVPILSCRLTLRYQDFSDFDVQIPDKNYRSILLMGFKGLAGCGLSSRREKSAEDF